MDEQHACCSNLKLRLRTPNEIVIIPIVILVIVIIVILIANTSREFSDNRNDGFCFNE